MASGHMNRVKRPDTWLHRPMLQNVKKVLANPEQATHDPTDAGAGVEPRSAKINFCGIFGVVRFSTLQHYPRVSGHRQTSQSGPKSATRGVPAGYTSRIRVSLNSVLQLLTTGNPRPCPVLYGRPGFIQERGFV